MHVVGFKIKVSYMLDHTQNAENVFYHTRYCQ